MIPGVRLYDATKDSRLPWVGRIPDHWQTMPNRAMLRKRKLPVGERHAEYMLLSLTKAGVIVRDVSTGKGKFSADMGTSQEVRCGDLVFCLFDVPETPRTVGLSPHNGMITGAYTVFECIDPLLARYLELYYRAMDDRKLLSPMYTGLRNTIPASRFLGIKSPVPPPHEQHAIVRFLDHVDRKVRRYIRAKQKLIALLEEEKQAIIHQAVTRGLDPNVRLKPSGVEWLGDVPEHWEVVPARCFFSESDERSLNGTEELLSVSHLTGVTPRTQKTVTMFLAESYVGHKVCRPGDLAVNTMWAWMGALGVSEHLGLVSPSYAVYRPHSNTKLIGKYADLLLRSAPYVNQYICLSTGIQASRLRLYPDQFLRIGLLCPPVGEQKAILSAIAAETHSVDLAIDASSSAIRLLREYHTCLISDVVTGKLDVREAAARLPEELDDRAAIEEDAALDADGEEVEEVTEVEE